MFAKFQFAQLTCLIRLQSQEVRLYVLVVFCHHLDEFQFPFTTECTHMKGMHGRLTMISKVILSGKS